MTRRPFDDNGSAISIFLDMWMKYHYVKVERVRKSWLVYANLFRDASSECHWLAFLCPLMNDINITTPFIYRLCINYLAVLRIFGVSMFISPHICLWVVWHCAHISLALYHSLPVYLNNCKLIFIPCDKTFNIQKSKTTHKTMKMLKHCNGSEAQTLLLLEKQTTPPPKCDHTGWGQDADGWGCAWRGQKREGVAIGLPEGG